MWRAVNRWLRCSLPGILCLAAFDLRAQSPILDLQLVATGLTNITSIASAHDGSGRLFVTQQNGLIKIISGSQVLPTNFLSIAAVIEIDNAEQGLLGLAFSPGYRTNGLFYIAYTHRNGDVALGRYSVSADPNVGIYPGEELLVIPHPTFGNHNGGQLQFGPDGYLYMSVGDGGSGCDPSNNAQNLGVRLGKILRLDVNTNVSYAVPPTNPFVGVPGAAPEIWAYGLRNPWRFSFDTTTGDLYIGDAGENTREEIDLQPAGDPGGENYGWRLYEGFLTNTCSVTFSNVPTTLPIFDYGHTNGNCVVVGGYVYRGSKNPPLVGKYVYGDFCSGTIAAAMTNGAGGWSETQLFMTNLEFSTFGQDDNGELYVASYSSASLLHIVPRNSVGDAIPDWWRAQYFGGSGATTNSTSCATCDADGDGMSNYQEFMIGTDPTNSASSIHITAIRHPSNDVCVTWTTVGGLTNIVQGGFGAADGSYSNDFVDLSPAIVAAGSGPTTASYLSADSTTNPPAGYYRIRIPLPIADDASDPAYNYGWAAGANGGTGFTPWTFIVLSSFNKGLFFTGPSTSNGNGDSPGIDINGKSWGISGNVPSSAAFRSFAGGPLRVGQSFAISLDTGNIDPTFTCGFALRNGSSQRFEIDSTRNARFQFLYNSSDPTNSYKVVDAAGQYNIGVPFTDTGLRLVFTLNSVDTYTLLVIDNASGATNATVNGTLATATGSTLDSFAIFNNHNTTAQRDTLFINSLSVTGP